MNDNNRNKKDIAILIVCIVLLLLGCIAFFSARWYITEFGDTGFDSILYTLFSEMSGTDSAVIQNFMMTALLPGLATFVVLTLVLWAKRGNGQKIYPFTKKRARIISLILSAVMLLSAAVTVDLPSYIAYVSQQSSIYQDEYVDPLQAKITFPEEKRNLIYIFLESMENTYMSADVGGALDRNVMPELTALVQDEDNINFSHTDGIGGFHNMTGASWTIGAMVAHTSGIPLKVPIGVDRNEYGQDSFLPGVNTITNVLQEAGYYQTLMVGSDANFGGRKPYFEQHGLNRTFDIFTAREVGIVPPGYFVFWGMEDMHLFDFAKQELLKIAEQEQPFNFTMLTVDTHRTNGYVCRKCIGLWGEQYENVISCSSKQVAEFVNWIKQQDFYENTTIIIAGDHITMDEGYIDRNVAEDYDRTVYNCIINSPVETEFEKNRQFVAADMFPTTLAAIGCEIEGERLGLGTNLFSGQPTLAEEMGLEEFDAELLKTSDYYTKNFFFD
ncbi:MAG: LTA synthase family protein [Anaerotignum sp.]|nr:LTA synthase family protein [Anaerotignum sp.]